jgi:hypothetical protein
MKQSKHPLPWTAGKHANKKSWYVYDGNKIIVASFNTEEQAASCAVLANERGSSQERNKQRIEYIMYYAIGFVVSVLVCAFIFLT